MCPCRILNVVDEGVQGFAVGETVITTVIAITQLFVYQHFSGYTRARFNPEDLVPPGQAFADYAKVFFYHWGVQVLLGLIYGTFSVRLASWHNR